MASQNNLNAVFTDIANAIRDKKGSVNTIKPINMADEILTLGGIKNFITTRNAQYLFYLCKTLTSEQLASLLKYDDTSGATNMSNMFGQCSSLTSIPQIDTSNATNMNSMFYYCSNLTTIPLIDTSKATNMNYMFNSCSNLTSIPQIDTSKSTDMSFMFSSCSSLTTIPQLNTSSCENMQQMFGNCSNLTSIPQLDTSKATNMNYMFYYCSNLTTIPLIDTSKATNMNYMFNNCHILEKIDITALVFSSNYSRYFAQNCYSLKALIIRTVNSTSTIPSIESNAFQNCYHFYGTVNATYNPDGLKDGAIYVPDDKVEAFKAATNWSVFADIIKPLSEYVE